MWRILRFSYIELISQRVHFFQIYSCEMHFEIVRLQPSIWRPCVYTSDIRSPISIHNKKGILIRHH